jgi:hypothetical protein
MIAKIWTGILSASLWIVMVGLMLASSGLDGRYMSMWMSPGAEWLGYVLNTVTDIASVFVMYWYGRLQQSRSSKKREMSQRLLAFEAVSVVYSWLLSWRQLRMRLYSVEIAPLAAKLGGSVLANVLEIEIAALLFAGLVPLTLVGVGYAQSLLAGKMDDEQKENEPKTAKLAINEPEPVVVGFVCETCGYSAATQQALNAHQRKHAVKAGSNGNGHGLPVVEEVR